MPALLNTAFGKIAAFAVDPVVLSGLLLIVVLLISPSKGAATERAR